MTRSGKSIARMDGIRYQPAGSICPTFEAVARLLGCARLASVERPFAPDKGASIPGWRRDPAKLRPRTPAPPRDIAKPLASCRSGTQRRKNLLNFEGWKTSLSLSLYLSLAKESRSPVKGIHEPAPSFLLSKNIDKEGLRRHKGPSFIPDLL